MQKYSIRLVITLVALLIVILRVSAQTPIFDNLSTIDSSNAKQLVELITLEEPNTRVLEAKFSPDGHALAYIGDDVFAFWELETQTYRWRTTEKGGDVLSFSPDGSQLVATADRLSLWDTTTVNDPLLLRVPQWGDQVPTDDVAFAPNRNGKNEVVSVRALTGGIIRWRADTGEFISTYSYGFNEFHPVIYSRISDDGGLNVIVIPSDHTVEFRNTIRGEVRNRIRIDTLLGLDSNNPPPLSLNPLAFTTDNRTVILEVMFSLNSDLNTIIWLSPNGKIVHQIPLKYGHVGSARLSPDENILAVGSREGEIYLLNAETGDELNLLDAHSDWVTSMDFNPTGTLLMSSGEDGTIRLWGVPRE